MSIGRPLPLPFPFECTLFSLLLFPHAPFSALRPGPFPLLFIPHCQSCIAVNICILGGGAIITIFKELVTTLAMI